MRPEGANKKQPLAPLAISSKKRQPSRTIPPPCCAASSWCCSAPCDSSHSMSLGPNVTSDVLPKIVPSIFHKSLNCKTLGGCPLFPETPVLKRKTARTVLVVLHDAESPADNPTLFSTSPVRRDVSKCV